MTKKSKSLRSHCPVNFGLEMFGDKWTLLILRDIIFRGKRTYGEFLKSEEGFATNILSTRLQHLVDVQILDKTKNPEDARKDFYQMTEKGFDLIPMILEMVLWSSKYDEDSEARRIQPLLELIRSRSREASEEIKEKVRAGRGIVGDYLNT